MYYTNSNYEAFARPKKPENVDNKSAYLIGAGLASLAAACFLIRDGQMKGENIHILVRVRYLRRKFRWHQYGASWLCSTWWQRNGKSF